MQCSCGGVAKTTYEGTREKGMTITSHCECGRCNTRTIKGTKPRGLRAKFKRNRK